MRKPISILLAIAMLLSVLSALTFTVSAENEEEFTAVNLSLGYDIGMTYYTNVDYASDVTAQVTINGRTDTVRATNSDGKASFSFNGIAPHELGAEITTEVYKGGSVTGIENETTVKEICTLYLDNSFSGYSAEVKERTYKLVSNLLQYGECARIYKNVAGSILIGINSNNYEPDVLGTPFGTPTSVESNPSLSLRGLSVFFDTTNRYYIKFASTDISKVRFTVDSTAYTEFGEEGGYYFFYTNPMSAKDTNNVVSIKGYYEDTKIIDLNYSIEQYIIDLIAASAGSDMLNLAKSIYNYSESANAYTQLDFSPEELPPVILGEDIQLTAVLLTPKGDGTYNGYGNEYILSALAPSYGIEYEYCGTQTNGIEMPGGSAYYNYGDDYIYTFMPVPNDEHRSDNYGWHATVIDNSKEEYAALAEQILGYPLKSLYLTYGECLNLTIAPDIPDTVTSLEGAYLQCDSLTTIPVIPNSVVNMNTTFEGCDSLEIAPALPNNLISASRTFAWCTSLTTAPALPASVKDISGIYYLCGGSLNTYTGSIDPSGDFSNYVIPSGVTNMQESFRECTNITKAPVLPNVVSNVEGLFSECSSLTTAPVLPNSVKGSMERTFSSCESLITYTGSTYADGDFSHYQIPYGVTNLREAFFECNQLTKTPVISNSVIDMERTFAYCESLTTVTNIGNSVENLYLTFQMCKSLISASVTIPNSVTNMYGTFEICENLETGPATISNSVTNAEHMFSGCRKLTNAPVIPNGVTGSIEGIFRGCESLVTYAGSTDPDGDFSHYVLPNGITDMESAFRCCKLITKAPVISSNTTNMKEAFQECDSLIIAPTIPNGVTDMTQTFYGCSSLTSAPSIPTSVTDMTSTFVECSSLSGAIYLPCHISQTWYYNCPAGVIKYHYTGCGHD